MSAAAITWSDAACAGQHVQITRMHGCAGVQAVSHHAVVCHTCSWLVCIITVQVHMLLLHMHVRRHLIPQQWTQDSVLAVMQCWPSVNKEEVGVQHANALAESGTLLQTGEPGIVLLAGWLLKAFLVLAHRAGGV